MDVGLSLSPCLTSPLRVTHVLDLQRNRLPAKSHQATLILPFSRFKGTAYVISLFLFSSPKLSRYHLHEFGISLINSYPTSMITAETRVTERWRGGGRWKSGDKCGLCTKLYYTMIYFGKPSTPTQLFNKEGCLHAGRSNLRPLQVKREIEFMWYRLCKQHSCNLGTLNISMWFAFLREFAVLWLLFLSFILSHENTAQMLTWLIVSKLVFASSF